MKTLRALDPCGVAAIVIALTVGACSTLPRSALNAPPPPSSESTSPNPPANVNLSGYPLEFRQGYADGCTSARGVSTRDAARYKSDAMYRQGWEDGKAICAKR